MRRSIFIVVALFFLMSLGLTIPVRGAVFSFSHDLKFGASGSEVTLLQQYLTLERYFKVAPTGYFGGLSRALANAATITEPAAINLSTTSSNAVPHNSSSAPTAPAPTSTIISQVIAPRVGGVTATPPTTINNTTPPPPPSPSVSITPASITMLSAATTTFVATLTNDDGDAIMWQASRGSINPVTGAFTAPTVYATTTVTITAQSQTISAVSSTATVTVVARPITISITPATTSLLSGATITFTATVLNATNTAVVWSSVLGSVDASSGIYTAPTLSSTTYTATDTVTAMSVADNAKVVTATVSISNGFIDWWQFAEGSGTVAFDTANFDHSAVWHGAPNGDVVGFYTEGPVVSSSAGYFDGATNYINPGLTLSYTATSSFTWSAWMDLDDSMYATNVVLLGNRGTSHWIRLTPSAFEYDGAALISNAIPTSQWELVTITKIGSSFYYYQNGSLVGSASSTAAPSDVPFYIGTDPTNNFDGYAMGGISDVRLYSIALDQSQIQSIYNAEAPITISVSPNGLIGHSLPFTQQFTATVSNTTNTAVTWRAAFGSIDSNGFYTSLTSGPPFDDLFVTSVADPRQSITVFIEFLVGDGDSGGA